MGYKHQEIPGKKTMLAIVSESREVVPPKFASTMLVTLLESADAKGPFSFHYDETNPSMPVDGRPQLLVFEQGSAIGVRIRCGDRTEHTAVGKLYLPKGETPQLVLKQLRKALQYLNDEWIEYGITYVNGETKGLSSPALPPAPPQQLSAIEPPRSVSPSVPVPAVRIAPTPPSPVQTLLQGGVFPEDEATVKLVSVLLQRARPNALLHYQVLRYAILRGKQPQEGERNLVSETIARLEKTGVLRRVRVEDQGEWQLEGAYLLARGIELATTPLPKVVPKRRGSDVCTKVVRPDAPVTVAPTPSPPPTVVSSMAHVTVEAGVGPKPAKVDREKTYQKLIGSLSELRRLEKERRVLLADRLKAVEALRAIDMKAEQVEESIERCITFLTGEEFAKVVGINDLS